MNAKYLIYGAAVVVLAGGALLQYQINQHQGAEIAALRDELRGVRLGVAVVEQRQSARGVDGATLVQEQGSQLAQLKADLQALRQEHAAHHPARPPVHAPASIALAPQSSWKNVGRENPGAAVETLLNAANGGDVNTMAASLVLNVGASIKAKALFDRLPASVRAEYGSPEKLVALFSARDYSAVAGMQVISHNQRAADEVTVRVRTADQEGKMKIDVMPFKQTREGWRLIVSESVIDRYERVLTGQHFGAKK